jgi:hypothetical protein
MKRPIVILVSTAFLFAADSQTGLGKQQEKSSDSKVSSQQTSVTVAQDDVSPDETKFETTAAATSPEAGEQINWQVISSGGTEGISTGYILSGTVGETAGGVGESDNYGLRHGFWQDFGAGGGCCGLYTGGYTGNCNCSTDGLITLNDITLLIDNVYITKAALCCPENGNTNGSTDGLVTLNDITVLIDHVYITKGPTAPCP